MGAAVTGGFLDRWSRRKRAAGAQDTGATQPAAPEAGPETAAPVADSPAAEEPVDEALLASLPPLEEITATTDIRAFLQKGVPAALRNAALRRAWVSDPLIAGYEDPARDYFWDWNTPGGVPGGGGTLDPDRVARMAQDIAGKLESGIDDSVGAVREGADDAEDDGTAATATAPEQPVTADAQIAAVDPPPVTTGPVPGAGTAENRANPATDTPLRRRHGGALPG